MSFSLEIEQVGLLSVPVLSVLAFSRHSRSILSDFLLLVMPQYLTILQPRALPVTLLALLAIIWINLLFAKNSKKIDHTTIFNMSRFIVIAQTTICIFLCDFSFWVPRLGKRDFFGVGLMDLGVAFFLFNGAIVSSKISTQRLARNSITLLVLGAVRLAVVNAFGLDVNPREYGTHWNFYFTLFFVNILHLVLNSRYNLVTGAILCAAHELSLFFTAPMILSDSRATIFLKNKEGILSLVPFVGVYLIFNHLGSRILNPEKALATSRNIALASALVYAISRTYSEPSRRLSNMAYLSWVSVLQFGFLFAAHLCGKHMSQCFGELQLPRMCSRYMLHIFLASNLLILAFKLAANLESATFLRGNLMNLAYLMISFVILPEFIKIETKIKKS